MTKILLTGGSGFLGRYVLQKLLHLNVNVLVPTRNPEKLLQLFGRQFSNLTVVEGLFYSPEMIENYRKFQPDAIIHLAAIRGEGNGKWRDYYTVNVKGTEILVQFALENRLRKFIYCSTVGVFGTIPARLPADPWTPANPDNYYHKSKYIAESYVVNELRHQISFAILRPTISYGPGDNGFIAKLTVLVKKKIFPVVNPPIKIHLLDVRTFANAIPIILNANEKEIIVNLADKEPIGLKTLVDVIHNYFYGKKYPYWLKMPGMVFSLSKTASKLLGFSSINTSLQLLSESWYYDTSHMEHLRIQQIDTYHGILNYLKKVYPK